MKKFEEIAKKALEEANIRKKNFSSKEIKAKEIGGPKGLEPTRYGDWEKKRNSLRFLDYLFNLLSTKL